MAYLLDANVLISAKRLHYGLDFCPAFWNWIVLMHKAAKVFSIYQVGPPQWTVVFSRLQPSRRFRHWARSTNGFVNTPTLMDSDTRLRRSINSHKSLTSISLLRHLQAATRL